MAVRVFQRPDDADAREIRLRLICLPHAGAGAALFRTWPQQLPPGVAVVCPALPGRDARAGEPAFARMAPLVDRLADDVRGLLDRPYALYGHSLGAFVAFELAHELARRQAAAPSRLIVSAQRGPSVPYDRPPIYALPDDQFLAGVRRRHGPIPPAILADPSMATYLLRLLRADFTLVEAYRREERPPLACPISVYGGRDDPTITTAQLDAWESETTGGCVVSMIGGAHFFHQTHQVELLSHISRDVLAGDRQTSVEASAGNHRAAAISPPIMANRPP